MLINSGGKNLTYMSLFGPTHLLILRKFSNKKRDLSPSPLFIWIIKINETFTEGPILLQLLVFGKCQISQIFGQCISLLRLFSIIDYVIKIAVM